MRRFADFRSFADAVAGAIIETEKARLNDIMGYVANKIQGDFVAVTYNVIDAFYADYTQPPRIYIRTDEYKKRHNLDKNGRKHDKKGHLSKMSKTEIRRKNDKSLMSAIKDLDESGQPAIGICQPIAIDGIIGYQAGVLFDEDYFNNESGMKHSVKGSNFTEWDIVEDFLWGVHGNESVYTTTPSAGYVLAQYIDTYQSRFDKHYKDACRKFIK